MKIKSTSRHRRAFSLLEVMIAIVAFATASIAILGLVSRSIDNARRLQRPMVDASLLASQLSITNKLLEGTSSGSLDDLLGDSYRGYTWTEDILEEQTNKLFHVDVIISRSDDKSIVSAQRFLFYRPESPAGSMDGATTAR